MAPTKAEYYQHPLFAPNLLKFDTLQIDALFSDVMQWFWSGLPGGLIHGDARNGKTTGLEILQNQFYDRQQHRLPSKLVVIPPRDYKTTKAVYYELCRTFDLGLSPRQTTDRLAEAVLYHLSDIAFSSESKTVLLMIDEIQRLKPHQLEVFAEIYDKMRFAGLQVFTLMVANSQECTSLLNDIVLPENSHIRGRFFNRLHEFRGFTSVREIRFALEQYDKRRFPEPKGKTYTEYFLPQEHQQGFRLHSLSQLIWQTYRQAFQQPYRLQSWPAQYFFSAITMLLTDYLADEGIDVCDEEMITDVIDRSGLIPALVSISEH